MTRHLRLLAAAVALAAIPVGVAAQYASAGLELMQAVRDRDGAKTDELVREHGEKIINWRDGKGEGPLHVLAARRDNEWLQFFIGKGGDPNWQTGRGDTALMIASRIGWLEGVETLLRSGAKPDLANRAGETALIGAVQQRQMAVVRRLLQAGANPNRTDNVTGRSARDYARIDNRSGPELLKLMDTVKPASARPVAGPSL